MDHYHLTDKPFFCFELGIIIAQKTRKEQFADLKKKCKSGNFNPMSILTKGKNVEKMNLKTYTPVQIR